MAVFQANAIASFEGELVKHSRKFAPGHAASLGDQQLRVCIHAAVSRARALGITLQGPMRLWVELTFMFGSGFNTDPQLQEFAKGFDRPLQADDDQIQRAVDLRTKAVEFAERIAGKDGEKESAAVSRFRELTLDDLAVPSEQGMVTLLGDVHPAKAAAAGNSALVKIINKARSQVETFAVKHAAGPMGVYDAKVT